MKKLLLLGILILALVAFVACGDEETTDDTEETVDDNGDAEVVEDTEEAAPTVEVDLSSAEKCVEAFIKAVADQDADLLSAICTTVSEESHDFMFDGVWAAIEGDLTIDGGYEIIDNENGTFDVDFESALFFQGDSPRSLSLLVTERDGDWVLCGSVDRMVKLEETEEEAAE